MKKASSIFLAFLLLLTTIHFSIATHYCGGKLAAVKYSFTGEKAACGMEDKNEAPCPFNNSIRSYCCNDQLTLVSTDQNYFSYYSVYKIITEKVFQILALPITEMSRQYDLFHSVQNYSDRQTVFRTNRVLLDFICTFRI
jgi:hypothetical protein